MGNEVKILLYVLGYFVIGFIIKDQVYNYLNNLRSVFTNAVKYLHNLSKKLFDSGKFTYNEALLAKNKIHDSKARGLFFFLAFMSFLLVYQNLVMLSTFFEEIKTLQEPIFGGWGLLGWFHWSHLLALGIILVEFLAGWAFYTARKDQKEDPYDKIHASWITVIILVFLVFLIGESIVWYQLSYTIADSASFINPARETLWAGFIEGIYAVVGGGITVIEFYMGYKMSDYSEKFDGFKLIEYAGRVAHYLQSVAYFLIACAVFIGASSLFLFFIVIWTIEQVLILLLLPFNFFIGIPKRWFKK